MIEELKTKLDEAIRQYDSNRAKLLQKAFDEGGQDAVKQLEDNYTRMRNEYMNLLKAQLDQNSAGYQQLIADANDETGKLKKSLGQMQKVTDIINLLSSVAEKVGKIAVLV